MKKHLILCISIILLYSGLASASTSPKSLMADFYFSVFNTPDNGPYVETCLQVKGASVQYQALKNGNYQAAIEVSMVYTQGEKVRYFDKYNLLSPEIKDTVTSLFNFMDQKRVSLANGTYQLTITIRDKNSVSGKVSEVKQDVLINYQPNVISISDIQFLSSFKPSANDGPFTKNGFELQPLLHDFYGQDNNNLKFYAEIYNTSSILNKDAFLVNYYIENYEQKRILDNFKSVNRQTAKPINVVMSDIDISSLYSGNYNLVIEVRNRSNELLAFKQHFFQRSKPLPVTESGGTSNSDYRSLNVSNTFVAQITNRDTLSEYILCLWPISSPNENTFAMNQLEIADVQMMQQYFYDFWQKRDAANPNKAWTEYKIEVDKVNNRYSSGNKKGYLTERGRVYLQYGAPSTVSEVYNEPNSYPYEIWQYYKTKNETNRKFVFYNPEIGTNDFRLLHSDAKGEIADRQWQLVLRKRNDKSIENIDRNDPRVKDSYGNHTDQIFNNPH